ncbi:MAG: dienelactone hydrolase family protein [Alphaproteobacteria bacterium]|nr:dienelactone hydrolase family protein [Alphaproteobacteria bacterium]
MRISDQKKDQYIALFDHYVHSEQPRREFLQKLVRAAGGVAAAAAILPWLEGTGAEAAMVSPQDNRLDMGMESFVVGGSQMSVYVARPKGAQKLPAVVVIHENRGLTPHIQDVARRLALEGFVAVAPDMLSPRGGTPKDRDLARTMLRKENSKEIASNMVAVSKYARAHPNSTGKVGVVGFCWGGGQALNLAVNDPQVNAAVGYYGNPPKNKLERINAPILLNYAEDDPKRTKRVKPFVAALKKLGKPHELYFYPGTKHAFNNDARPARYHKEAATLAWKRTVAHFKKHL